MKAFLIFSLATIFHVIECKEGLGGEFVVYATTMDSYNVVYDPIVMEISSPLVSTVIVGKLWQYILLCKKPE